MQKQSLTILGAAIAVLVVVGVLWTDTSKVEIELIDTLPVTNKHEAMETKIAGLEIEVLTEGTGVGVESGQTAVVHYMGMLTNGEVFDSSIPRGKTFFVQLGRGEVIKGWELGLVGMKVGEKRKLTISPELGYGKDGYPPVIPQNATLIFEVTLEAIK